MGDKNSNLTSADAHQLLRRTGFGARPDQVAEIVNRTRGAVVAELLNFKPTKFKPTGKSGYVAHNRWVKYMIVKSSKRGKAGTKKGLRGRQIALQEKLVLFWHDHFATGLSKVYSVKLMGRQNLLLRQHCKGNFKEFVKAINMDAAMLEYLDTVRNHRFSPNENYGRELQELFTLGVKDFLGAANYDQEDIVQIARAFTGWGYDYRSLKVGFDEFDHNVIGDADDDGVNPQPPETGDKVIYRNHGNFGSNGISYVPVEGEGATEIDNVIEVILQHTDTDTPPRNTTARHIAKKLFQYFTHTNPETSVIDEVIGASSFDSAWDIQALLSALFVHDAFYETGELAPFDSDTKKSVRWPIDYLVGTLACLNMRLRTGDQYVDGQDGGTAYDYLGDMGQTLLDPPSVFGWDWEEAWISSFSTLARCSFACDIVTARGGTSKSKRYLQLGKVLDLAALDDGSMSPNAVAIVDAVLAAMGIPGQLDTAQHKALRTYLTGLAYPMSDAAHVNLTPDFIDEKLRGLLLLVLESPAYHIH